MNLNNKKHQSKLSSFLSSGISKVSSTIVEVHSKKRRRKEHSTSSTNTCSIINNNSTTGCSRFQQCVICAKSFPTHLLPRHASFCVEDTGEESISVETTDRRVRSQKEKNNFVKNTNHERFSLCPICNKSIPYYDLSRHAQACVNNNVLDETSSTSCSSTSSTSCTTTSSGDKKNIPDNYLQSSNNEISQQWRKIIKDVVVTNIEREELQPEIMIPISEPLPGLFLLENFISEEEEDDIIKHLDSSKQSQADWKHAKFNGHHFGKRWGVHCNLRDRRVYPEETPLPSFIVDLIIPKLQQLEIMKGCIPNEANAISYERAKGHFLKSHVDDRQLSKEAIANLSLAGDCIMTFTLEKQHKMLKHSRNGDLRPLPKQHKILLKRRALQVLTSSARYDYSHGIANQDLLSDRRISLTMRQSPITK